MYTITCDNHPFHIGNSTETKYHAYSAVLSMELNKSGTLTFSLAPGNIAFKENYIKIFTSVIRVLYSKPKKTESELVWKGRVITTSKDFYGNVTYTCEGWMGVLNDSVVLPIIEKIERQFETEGTTTENVVWGYGDGSLEELEDGTVTTGGGTQGSGPTTIGGGDNTITGDYILEVVQKKPSVFFTELINAHNTQVGKSLTPHVVLGPDEASYEYAYGFPDPNYETTFDYIMSNFIDNPSVGGRIEVIDSDIYYYTKSYKNFKSNNQVIKFGATMLDLNDTLDMTDMFTAVIATGKDRNDYTVSVEKQYPAAVAKYGLIYRHLDFTANYAYTSQGNENNSGVSEDPEVANIKKSLEARANAVLEKKFLNPSVEIKAMDLSLIDSKFNFIKVGEYVAIDSKPHGIQLKYTCTAANIDICNPTNSVMTFGSNAPTLTPVANNKSASKGRSKDLWTKQINGTKHRKGTLNFITDLSGVNIPDDEEDEDITVP